MKRTCEFQASIQTICIADKTVSHLFGFLIYSFSSDVTPPKLTDEERQDPGAEVYLRNFDCLINISKVIGRVLRFNFSAQSDDFRAPSLVNKLSTW